MTVIRFAIKSITPFTSAVIIGIFMISLQNKAIIGLLQDERYLNLKKVWNKPSYPIMCNLG